MGSGQGSVGADDVRVFLSADGSPPLRTAQKGIISARKDGSGVQPVIRSDAHVRVFNTSDEKDRKELERIFTCCARGYAAVSERRVDLVDGVYIVFLIWTEFYQEFPNEIKRSDRHVIPNACG